MPVAGPLPCGHGDLPGRRVWETGFPVRVAARVPGWEPGCMSAHRVWGCTGGPSASMRCMVRPPDSGLPACSGWAGVGAQAFRPLGETGGVSTPRNNREMQISARAEIQIPEVCSQNRSCLYCRGAPWSPVVEVGGLRYSAWGCWGGGAVPSSLWAPQHPSHGCLASRCAGRTAAAASLWAGLWFRAGVSCPDYRRSQPGSPRPASICFPGSGKPRVSPRAQGKAAGLGLIS